MARSGHAAHTGERRQVHSVLVQAPLVRARCSVWTLCLALFLSVASGCATNEAVRRESKQANNQSDALTCLKAALRYPHNPAVRVAAVEALEAVKSDDAAAWIRTAITDAHPGVRFAGCVAAGKSMDRLSESAVRNCLRDRDPNVRIAALFALHRLGAAEGTTKLATYLLTHRDIGVRRNAAYVLGLLGEPGTMKALARAMKDHEKGVRDFALEAMACLGNVEARQELVFMTEAGVGSEEVFALSALASTGDAGYAETFRYKLSQGTHIETRLAAARGLGLLGFGDGFDLALNALSRGLPPAQESDESHADRLLRVRLLAASALGALGHAAALPSLARTMKESRDPRIQVAAARAVLEIISKAGTRELPRSW